MRKLMSSFTSILSRGNFSFKKAAYRTVKFFIFFIILSSVSYYSISQNLKLNTKKAKLNSVIKADTLPKFEILSCRVIEVAAQFPGGEAAWNKYLEKTIDSAIAKWNGAPVGSYKVVVQFIISRDGRIDKICANTSFGYGMENEVIRIIGLSPKWIPAQRNGRAVIEVRQQVVTFTVSQFIIT